LTLPPAPHGGLQRIPTLEPIVRLQSGGVEGVASRCVRFNPRYGMLASGGEDLVSTYPPSGIYSVRMDQRWRH
jgi:hypothetical protein